MMAEAFFSNSMSPWLHFLGCICVPRRIPGTISWGSIRTSILRYPWLHLILIYKDYCYWLVASSTSRSLLATPVSLKSRFKVVSLFLNIPWAEVGTSVGLLKTLHHPNTFLKQGELSGLASGTTWESLYRNRPRPICPWIPQWFCLNRNITCLPSFFDTLILLFQGKNCSIVFS